MEPPTLDYQKELSALQHSSIRRCFFAVIFLFFVGLAWMAVYVISPARQRYIDRAAYLDGYAALANHSMPAGMVVIDPNDLTPGNVIIGGVTYSVASKNADPFVIENLKRMQMNDSSCAWIYAQERVTKQGPALVYAFCNSLGAFGGQEYIYIYSRQFTPGSFPFYRNLLSIQPLCGLFFKPEPSKTTPVLLAGQPDVNLSVWTLPVRVGGRPEWIKFDHSRQPPTITSSFGRLHQSGNREFTLYF